MVTICITVLLCKHTFLLTKRERWKSLLSDETETEEESADSVLSVLWYTRDEYEELGDKGLRWGRSLIRLSRGAVFEGRPTTIGDLPTTTQRDIIHRTIHQPTIGFVVEE